MAQLWQINSAVRFGRRGSHRARALPRAPFPATLLALPQPTCLPTLGRLDARLLEVSKAHKQRSEYTASDWVFGSPDLRKEATLVHLFYRSWAGRVRMRESSSAHSFGRSYRAWLDELGTLISVQQRAMRHGNIRVTMNAYSDPVNDDLTGASSKIAGRATSELLTKNLS